MRAIGGRFRAAVAAAVGARARRAGFRAMAVPVVAVVLAGCALGPGGAGPSAPGPTAAPPSPGGRGIAAPRPAASPAPTPDAPGGPATPAALPPPTPGPLAVAPVPRSLVPSLARARADLPAIYDDGCHVDPAGTRSGACVYGDPRATTTVVLFGDSHAAQWFPALESLARARGWRLVSLTKSACASVDVVVWSGLFRRRYAECHAWRTAAMRRIARERPDVVVLSNARRYSLVVDGSMTWSTRREDVWSAGLHRTLDRLAVRAGAVVVLWDTPRLGRDPVACLARHRSDASRCAHPYRLAVATRRLVEDRAVAASTGARLVDPTRWLCTTDPCPAVLGRTLVYRDTHHMTATFSRSLAPALLDALRPVLPPR